MKIKASVPLTLAPGWAVLQQKLISVMEEAVYPFLEKYTHADGRIIWKEGIHKSRDGADDFYESFYNWPLLYLLGGGDHLLELGQRQWDATTRLMEEMGHVYKEYEIGYDQFHQSESYIYFYFLCMADPENTINLERAKRFAGFFIGEDPEAPNYDPVHKIIRCAHNGSKGPRWTNEGDQSPAFPYSPGMAVYGLPFEDVEGVHSFEDLKDPELAKRMGEAMRDRAGKGDVATNLHVCSLVTNAYLLTQDEKYRDWLVEYVGAWMDRATSNGGLLPDNVGLDGEVGQYMNGKWFGGRYGWSWPHGFYNIGMAAVLAGVQSFLLTRDPKYLELPRSQIREIMSKGKMAGLTELADQMSLRQHWQSQFDAIEEEDTGETWVVPYRHMESGWFDYQPMSLMYPTALWNICGADEDWEVIQDIQEKETYDWKRVSSFRSKEDAGHEQPWIAYLQGNNPDYPVKILQASLAQVYRRMEQIRQDETDPRDNHIHWWQELNPVTTEALIQLTLGAPQLLYNGGLLHAPVRYFDREKRRPGLPADVSALVEKVETGHLQIVLVNTSAIHSRELTLQAGTLGEHTFTDVTYDVTSSPYPAAVGSYSAPSLTTRTERADVNDVHLEVDLPPGTQICLQLGLDRCVGTPSYRQPF